MKSLLKELDWFSQLLQTRLKLYFNQESEFPSIYAIAPPLITNEQDAYSNFVMQHQLRYEDRILVALSLVPLLKPQLLDNLLLKNTDTDQRFTEFGCIKGQQHNGLIPTLETLLFILAGDNVDERMKYAFEFSDNHFLFQQKYLFLEHQYPNEPLTSNVLVPSNEFVQLIIKGRESTPVYSPNFPAKQVTTKLEWSDLVLEPEVMTQLSEVKSWMEHGEELLRDYDMGNKIKPGYRCLFYGPSGTGKTLSATLIGKSTGMDVYRIDLSMIASKYIGETEKNLSKIFDRAENKNWILFFDEADALFGKRTNVKDSHDKYANQEVSYLLQRVEDYSGLVILATNLKSNIDEAFARRFQNVIEFPMPKAEQRELLWQKTFSSKIELAPEINMRDIAKKYELTGGAILNVVRYCSLMAIKRPKKIILLQDVLEGIKREFQKEGKTI